MHVYYLTDPDDALSVLRVGFQDREWGSMYGVQVYEASRDLNATHTNDTVITLTLDVTSRDLFKYELGDTRRPRQEWCIPAKKLNAAQRLQINWGLLGLRHCRLTRKEVKYRAREARHGQPVNCIEKRLSASSAGVRARSAGA